MKGAVGKSYERSRAVVRVDAVRADKYTMQPAPSSASGGRLGGGGDAEVGRYAVKYAKGVEGRGDYEEFVDIIGLEALQGVIRQVYSDPDSASRDDPNGVEGAEEDGGVSGPREMLRPANMAQLSPRVFWSLAHHFSSAADTEEALRLCCPDLDWSYLSGRTRVLSEKARDNLRQERAAAQEGITKEGRGGEAAAGDYDRAAAAVGEVEEAMERMVADGRNAEEARRERMARAAAARMGGAVPSSAEAVASEEQKEEGSPKDQWRLVTPEEVDEDELRECILEGFKNLASGEEGKEGESEEKTQIESGEYVPPDDVLVEAWVGALLSDDLQIRNWRELSNADANVVLPAFSITPPTSTSFTVPVDETLVESVLESARVRSVDEIVLEILDGDQDVLEMLREESSAGTPRDLSNWAECPEMLLEASPGLRDRLGKGTENNGKKADEVVRLWCMRAKEAVRACPWLEWYVTPV
uniref:Uncharacterized protein n=1 Tax=Odontella aurita TaxID=265563 RepID=A0A7S4N5T5_9STRA